MGKRPKRKIVLFLVEGKSDREALHIVISDIYDQIDGNIEVFFPIIREDEEEKGGDITSKNGIHPRNIEDNIYKLFLRNFFDEQKILPKDIYEIVQIVDIDGVYIPDDAVIEGNNPNGSDKPYYTENAILCHNVDHIQKRNKYKRENLEYLCSLTNLKVKQKSPKYSIYYFSSNLDHFFHNSANLDYQEKYIKAQDFAWEYIENSNGFIDVITQDPDSSRGMNYDESWDFLKEGLNSLHRHTNIDILFRKLTSNDGGSSEE